MLLINKYIRSRVNRFIRSFMLIPFVGIQIRVGNDDLNETKFLNASDVNLMMNIASNQNKYMKWYITGDSHIIKKKLCRRYKNIVVYSKNKTKHYAKHTTDISIVIEHEILSKSIFMIISKSTFGLTAVLKSGLMLNSKKSLCYEIKNGNIYNIKTYFNSFFL